MHYRDLTVLDVGEKKLLFATDSTGAIGSKELDLIPISNEKLGIFLAQVPFMEILATGAIPSYVFLPICNEMHPTANGILKGVTHIMESLSMDPGSINGTTEENIPTRQTSAAILVMAVVEKDFTFPKAKAGEIIFSLGHPKVGHEVLADQGEIMTLDHMRRLRAIEGVGDVLPVGSKGMAYEAKEMVNSHGLALEFFPHPKDLLEKSAGPATVTLCSADASLEDELKALGLPLRKIAKIKEKP